MNKPTRISITGGIGSGKTYVSHIMQTRHNIPFYNADERARQLMNTDSNLINGIKELVGPEAYHPDGTLNRATMASYIFASPAHTDKINHIVHPAVKRDYLRWAARQATSFVGLESAILFEAHFEDVSDIIITITAPLETRLQRAIERDKSNKEKITARIKAQMPQEEKIKLSDYTIINDGTTPLEPQIENILKKIKTI